MNPDVFDHHCYPPLLPALDLASRLGAALFVIHAFLRDEGKDGDAVLHYAADWITKTVAIDSTNELGAETVQSVTNTFLGMLLVRLTKAFSAETAFLCVELAEGWFEQHEDWLA